MRDGQVIEQGAYVDLVARSDGVFSTLISTYSTNAADAASEKTKESSSPTTPGGAGANALGSSRHHGMDRLQIDVPTPFSYIVSVADFVPKLRAAPAHIAYFCHSKDTPATVY